jgi:hypothetical protein
LVVGHQTDGKSALVEALMGRELLTATVYLDIAAAAAEPWISKHGTHDHTSVPCATLD